MRILVVDDDAMAAEMASTVLEDAGCRVVTAESAVRAMEVLAHSKDFDVVVSDMNMPGLSGLELFQTLRARGYNLPFVLLTGDDPQRLKRQEPRLGACIAKDSDLEDSLMAAIAEALSAGDRVAGPSDDRVI